MNVHSGMWSFAARCHGARWSLAGYALCGALLGVLCWGKSIVYRALQPTTDNVPEVFLSNHRDVEGDVIVILCWGGAKKRHMRLLVHFYLRLPTTAVVLLINPSTDQYLHGIPLIDYLGYILMIAEEHAACRGRLKLHCFSNHSLMILSAMHSAARQYQDQIPEHLRACVGSFPGNVDSIVFDSAPFFPWRPIWIPDATFHIFEAMGYYRAMGHVVMSTNPHTLLAHAALVVPVVLCLLLFRDIKCVMLRHRYCTPNALLQNVARNLDRFFPSTSTIYFLHCTGDQLVPSHFVHTFVTTLRAQRLSLHHAVEGHDRHIQEVVFDGASHVGMLRSQTEAYFNTLHKIHSSSER